MISRLHRLWVSSSRIAGGALSIALLILGMGVARAQVSYPLGSNGTMGMGTPNGDFTVAQDDLRVKVPGGDLRINRDFDGRQWVFNRQWSGLGNPSYYKASYASIGAYFTCDTIDGISSCDSTASSGAAFDPEILEIQQTRVPNDPRFGRDAEGTPLPDSTTIQSIARKGIGFTRSTDGSSYVSSKHPRFIVRPRAVPTLPASSGPDAHPASGRPGNGGVATVTVNGFRWTDRSGEWIEYDNLGRISSYGDRNDVRVWFQYGSHGQIERVLDDNGRTVFTLLYKNGGEFITEVRDHTPIDGPIRRVMYQYDDKGRLRRVTDARGNDTLFDYAGGSVVAASMPFKINKVTDAEGRITGVHYGLTGRIEKMTAPDGGVTEVEYGYDKLKKEFSTTVKYPQTAAGRRVVTRHFDLEGRMVRCDVNGKTLISASGSRQQMSYTDERGSALVVSRDAFDQITGTRNADGTSSTYSYNSGSLDLREFTDEAGVVARLSYDSRGNLVELRRAASKPDEQITEYGVNARGEVERVRQKGGPNANGGVDQDIELQLGHDGNGNLSQLIDGAGKTWRYEYDAMGNMTKAVDPLNHEWSYTYDVHGNRLTAEDANGLVTRFEYDKTDRLLAATDPRGKVKRLQYDSAGRLGGVVDEAGLAVTLEYDLAGRLTGSADPAGQRVSIAYDNSDRATKFTDGEGNVTGFDYLGTDSLDRGGELITRVSYPTFQRLLRYNSRRQLTLQTIEADGESRTYAAEYGPRGEIRSVTNPQGKAASKEFDSLGRPLFSTDELGRRVGLGYDRFGNLVRVTDALGHSTQLEYDSRGNLVREANAAGESLTYAYDDANRRISLTRPTGAKVTYAYDAAGRTVSRQSYRPDGAPELSDSFDWDDGGRLVGWETQNASSVSTYDDAGRLLSELVNVDGLSFGRSYTYYGNGQVKSYTGPDGLTAGFKYDRNGELAQVDLPGEGTISVTERTWFGARKVVLPGGTVQEFDRNGVMSITRQRVKGPLQTVLFDQESVYGKREELVSRTTQGKLVDYEYDDALRLTEADHAGWGGITESFVVDDADNRLSDEQVPSQWVYDEDNRLKQRGTVSYQYDLSGNLVRKVDAGLQEPGRTTSYDYDAHNRLVGVRNGAGEVVARYTYDPFGYRLSREVTAVGAGETGAVVGKRWFLQGAEGLLAEISAGGTVTRSYGWQPEQPYSTAPLFMRDGSSFYYYHNDPLGTPQLLTNRAGAIVWSAGLIRAFGSLDGAAGAVEQPWRFPGQYHDAETGLHYNLHRYYDPGTGRYITRDPLGLAGGLNAYAYVDASPTNYRDPSGLVLDTIADVGFILYDGYRLVSDNLLGDCDNLGENASALGLDVLGAITPFATGLGPASRAARRAEKLAEKAGKRAENAVGFGKKPNGLGVSDPPQRYQGPWTERDLARAEKGQGPLDMVPKTDRNGREMPLELHHADQMPGSAIHEVDVRSHRRSGVHGEPERGVTDEMRDRDTSLHWQLRGQEMGNPPPPKR